VSYRSPIEWVGIWFAVALVTAAIALVWAPAIGVRLSAQFFYICIGLFLGSLALRFLQGKFHLPQRQGFQYSVTSAAALAAISATILVVRFVNISDIALPLWVDSVHHSALSRLIADQGILPASYRPFAAVDTVYYHLGYHSTVAVLSWLTGWNVESVMLVFGQLLNAGVCLSVYVLAARWTGRPIAGLAAMMVPGTLSLMPAYYVTWGRYTQLDGLAILPIAMLTYQSALESGSRRDLALSGVLAGGLLLVHYRVVYFLATFAAAYLIWHTAARMRSRQSVTVIWRRALAVAGVAVGVSAPWIWRVLTTIVLPLDTFLGRMTGSAEYNSVPWDLVTGDKNLWVYALAALGVAFAVRYRIAQVFVILLWMILTAALVNPTALGTPPTWLVNNFSLVISLFFPVALLVAFASSSILAEIERHASPPQMCRLVQGFSVALVLLAVVTARDQFKVVNPVTILATEDDVMALQWIRAQLRPDAMFLINERFWQGNTFVGTDGGYWIPNLTGRRTTMPIVFYTQGSPEYVKRVNSLARVIESAPDPNDPAFLRDLQTRGVTYVYIGAKGGPLPLAKFLQSEHYPEIYAQGGVHIFEVRY
jgi:hypothetical protein